MIHFEDSDSENNEFRGIEKSDDKPEKQIVDYYHNANNANPGNIHSPDEGI